VVLNTAGVNGGQTGTPKWIYRFSAAYDTDAFGITAIGRGVSAGKYVANGIECQTTCPSRPSMRRPMKATGSAARSTSIST
jgi:hypothetical protein